MKQYITTFSFLLIALQLFLPVARASTFDIFAENPEDQIIDIEDSMEKFDKNEFIAATILNLDALYSEGATPTT